MSYKTISDLPDELASKFINPSFITKTKHVYFLSHQGLGDNITTISAVNFLLQYYENVYLLCRSHFVENLKLIYINPNVILMPYIYTPNDSINQCNEILKSKYQDPDSDVLASGLYVRYFKNKITNKDFLTYKPNSYNYNSEYAHVRSFYTDINLDLKIYYEWYHFPSSDISKQYYETIKQYKLVFFHTLSSEKKINLSHLANNYLSDEYLIICPNENMYDKTHPHYELSQSYLNLLVPYYYDIIVNSVTVEVINSVFSCIVYPLRRMNKLKANIINIHGRG
jgi:hypothetical protein